MRQSDFGSQHSIDLKYAKGLQIGDNNSQTNIFYDDDPEEEKLAENLDYTSPYQGLAQFTTADSSKFYGRKKLIEELSKDLELNNLIFLLGASGSGKSSLVQAGLIPKLSNRNKNLIYLGLVPNENPFFSFYSQILAFISKFPKDYKQSDAQIALPPNDVQNAIEFLVKVIKTLKKSNESLWLIFIDQFEEIFTITPDNERSLFIQSINNLIYYLQKTGDKSIKIILTMRTDFLDQLMNSYPDFVVNIQSDSKKPFNYITPMTDRELKLVIKNPAATHGVNVDKDLIEEIINDFRGESRSLPLLQYTLDLLWKNDDLSDRLLNQKTYEDLGRVGGALQQQAEKIYQHFDSQYQSQSLEYIFIKLVTITADGKRVSKRENKSRFIAEGLETIVNELIKEHRLLISGRQADTVEIAHEALINSWSRLQGWIDNHEEAIVLERQLKESAQSWQKATNNPDKASSELWRGSKLERVFELRIFGFTQTNFNSDLAASDFKKTVEDFIKASIELRDREKREKDEQIFKLNQALTETSLREKSARVLNLLPTQPLDALVLAIQAMGENLDKFPQTILSSVKSSLNMAMEQAKESNCFLVDDTAIYALDLSPDGQKILTGNSDGKLRLCNLEGIPIDVFSGHKQAVRTVAFSPNGENFMSGSEDGTIRLWDLKGNYIIFYGHQDQVRTVAFSPKEEKIVSGSNDGTLCLWDFQGNILIQFRSNEPPQDNDAVCAVAFSPDGTKIVSGHSDKKIRLWNTQGLLIAEPFHGHQADDYKNAVSAVAFNPDGDKIVSGGVDHTVRLWDLEGNQIGDSFRGHNDIVCSVAFSPDGQKIISGSAAFDKTLRLWDLNGNRIYQPFRGHISGIMSCVFTSNGQMIISGGLDGKVRLWDLQGNQINQKLQGHNDAVCTVAFSPDGNKIVSGSWHWDGTLRLWDLKNNPPISALLYKCESHQRITSVAFSPNNKNIVSGSSDGTIHLWDTHGKLLQEPIRVHEVVGTFDGISSVAFSPDSQTIVTGGQDSGDNQKGTLRLWNLEGHPISSPFVGHQGKVLCIAWSPDGKLISSGGSDSTIYLWNLKGKLINRLFRGQEYRINSVAFSPDSRVIVSVFDNSTIALWNLELSSISKLIHSSDNSINSVAFSPDGQMIISAGLDGIRLWDLDGNSIGQPFHDYKYGIHAIAVSPDGQIIASGNGDKTLSLWYAHWRAWLQVCCGKLKYHPVFQNPQTDIEKQAKATAEKYIFKPQIGANELYDKAIKRIQEKDFTTAITLLHHAISCHPVYTQAYYQRGVAYYHVKRYFDAIKDFNQVLIKHSNIAEAYHCRGLSYRQVNNLEKAKTDLQQAIQLYQQQGKQKEAQQIQQYL